MRTIDRRRALKVPASGFAEGVTHDAVFAKALPKRTENKTKSPAIERRPAVSQRAYSLAFKRRALAWIARSDI
jgi:hypothetical protein